METPRLIHVVRELFNSTTTDITSNSFVSQLINELKETRLPIGLTINLNKSVEKYPQTALQR